MTALICCTALTSNPAFADQAPKNTNNWYVEGNAGYTILNPIAQDFVQPTPIPAVTFQHRSTVMPIALGVNTGYQFNPFLAAEVGFNYFFASQSHHNSLYAPTDPPLVGTLNYTITDMYALTLAGKATLPINTVFSLYGKLGLAYSGVTKIRRAQLNVGNVQTSDSIDDIAPLFGAGFQFNLRDNLYAQLGWMMIPKTTKQSACSEIIGLSCQTVNRPTINVVMAGLGYRFGGVGEKSKSNLTSLLSTMKRWYLEGNVGYTILSPVSPNHVNLRLPDNSFHVISHTNTVAPIGLGFNTGYQFNPFIAAEAGFNYFFTSQQNHMFETISQQFNLTRTITDMYALTLAGKVTIPLSTVFSLYSKFGLADVGATITSRSVSTNIQQTSSVSDISPLFGAGFQINLRDNLYIQLGWIMIPTKQTNCSVSDVAPIATCPLNRPMINEITGGLGYRFG
jgi:opacity protein-like surface antigen